VTSRCLRVYWELLFNTRRRGNHCLLRSPPYLHLHLAALSASSFPSTPLCPLTHISVLGRSRIHVTNPSSIQDRGWVYFRLLIRCITPDCLAPPPRYFPMPGALLLLPHLPLSPTHPGINLSFLWPLLLSRLSTSPLHARLARESQFSHTFACLSLSISPLEQPYRVSWNHPDLACLTYCYGSLPRLLPRCPLYLYYQCTPFFLLSVP